MHRFRLLVLSVGAFATTSVAYPAFAQESTPDTAAPLPGEIAKPRDPSWVESDPVAYPACSAAPAPELVGAAKGAFEAGSAAFHEADYTRALIYWEDAFRRDCTAVAMLKNLSHAYALDSQYRHAVLALETYLERGAQAAERPGLDERLAELKAQVASARHQAAAIKKAADANARDGATHGKAHRAQSPTSPSEEAAARDADFPETTRSPIPLVVAGVGAIALGLGAVQWIAAKHDEDKANKACPSRIACDPGVQKAGNRAIDREVAWSIVGAAGATFLVTGLVWYLAQEPTPVGASSTLGPSYRADVKRPWFDGFTPQLGQGLVGLTWKQAL